MKIGTRSLLFGAHQVLIHPWFVAAAWWRLYGFPWDPRLWVAFVAHDWGYWGKRAMDDAEGERHVELVSISPMQVQTGHPLLQQGQQAMMVPCGVFKRPQSARPAVSMTGGGTTDPAAEFHRRLVADQRRKNGTGSGR